MLHHEHALLQKRAYLRPTLPPDPALPCSPKPVAEAESTVPGAGLWASSPLMTEISSHTQWLPETWRDLQVFLQQPSPAPLIEVLILKYILHQPNHFLWQEIRFPPIGSKWDP